MGRSYPARSVASGADRGEERAFLRRQFDEEFRQVEAARARLATGWAIRLSDLGEHDGHAFGLFLGLLGETLSDQAGPDDPVERVTGDGLSRVRLEPLPVGTHAEIVTPYGTFAGRDHLITITPMRERQ